MIAMKNVNMEKGDCFNTWLAVMEWDRHGGVKASAKALGKQVRQINRYKQGASLSVETRLAMTAIAEGLRPWGTKL